MPATPMPDPDEPIKPVALPDAGVAEVGDACDVPDTAGVLSVETALMGPVGGGSFPCAGSGICPSWIDVGAESIPCSVGCQMKFGVKVLKLCAQRGFRFILWFCGYSGCIRMGFSSTVRNRRYTFTSLRERSEER